jgi:metallo-beta-lactamase family protein
MGEEVPVRCKVAHISGYSAHADQKRLIDWIRPMKETLKKVFVVQGDEEASKALAVMIEDKLAILAEVPSAGEEVVLE